MANVAVLGAGLLGAGMVEGMLRRGDAVRVWNRTRARSEPLAALGAELADTPADAVRGVDRVHLVLSDDAAVDAVLEAAQPAVLVLDHSTVSPAGVVRRSERWGARYVHAPVFMSPQNAREGTGTVLLSGPEALVAPARPALERMAQRVVHLGERVELAAAYKLFGNAMLFTLIAGAADVIAMARAVGVDPAAALALFDQFDPAPGLRTRGRRIARQDFEPPSFEVSMALKDARLMRQLAGDQALIVLPGIVDRLTELADQGLGGLDLAALGRER